MTEAVVNLLAVSQQISGSSAVCTDPGKEELVRAVESLRLRFEWRRGTRRPFRTAIYCHCMDYPCKTKRGEVE